LKLHGNAWRAEQGSAAFKIILCADRHESELGDGGFSAPERD
jgi:hypothetical protein